MNKFARYGKTVLSLVMLAVLLCSAVVSSETVTTETDHVWGNRTRVKAATCSSPAQYEYTCSICLATKLEYEGATDPDAHEWGEDWTETKAATCTETGTLERICKLNVHHKQTQTIPALGHAYGDYVVTTPATCTTAGLETSTCAHDSSHTLTRTIPATGHKWDAGVDSPAATCTTAGTKIYTCENDSSHTRTETVPALGHKWDAGTVTTQPTCTEPGVKTYICQHDSSHTKTESIPATGHQWDSGKIIQQPTLTQEGLIEYTCTVCGEVRQEKLPRRTLPNNTICAFGPRLRDMSLYPYDTDDWYMFTPFDASREGRQTYELVATNRFIVGTLTIDIRNGEMTVDYQLIGDTVNITLEFFTVLSQLDDIHVYEPEDLMDLRMTTRRPINLQDTFGDDRNLVLYFCSRASYTYNDKFKSLDYNSAAHQKLIRQMLEIMD